MKTSEPTSTTNNNTGKNTGKNVGKPAARNKRPKRVVENSEFDAFARRILRAYARRVAAGDLETLRSLASLSAELDAVTRLAVAGLRDTGCSWTDIGVRLGVSRQAAQSRFGHPAERGALDRRLLQAGLSITVPELVAVFAEHHPGNPPVSVCPGCGYRYPTDVTDCPTNATVRPLLYRRRGENKKALERLSPVQFADLHNRHTARTNRVAAVQAARPAVSPVHTAPTLLQHLNGKD